jgi:hypothetical protein
MPTALIWFAFGYAALKLVSVARARAPGFRRTMISFPDRLRAGEPALILTAFGVFVPLVLLISWNARRTMTRQFDASTLCYGRIMALRHLPAMLRAADDYTVSRRVYERQSLAYVAGGELGIGAAEVKARLERGEVWAGTRYAGYRTGRSRQGMIEETALALRCLRGTG